MKNTSFYSIPDSFLSSFARAAGVERDQASEQWAGFSDQLTDSERRNIEQGGAESGRENGRQFRELFP